MARNVTIQKNPWGRQGGLEPQRSDLWILDLSQAIGNISDVLQVVVPVIQPYFAQSVAFPELVVKADQFRRDSRPYNMPTFDEPPGPVRVVFLADAPDAESSEVYQVLDAWRAIVRAGRGAMGTEQSVLLNSDYRIDYAFNITAMLLKGGHINVGTAFQKREQLKTASQPGFFKKLFSVKRDPLARFEAPATAQQREELKQQEASARTAASKSLEGIAKTIAIENDLQYSAQYTFENAWLGSFKISELSYGTAAHVTIEAQFYVENVLDEYNDQKLLTTKALFTGAR